MLDEKRFDAGAAAINYAEGPANGPPLVLFSGFTGRWQFWLPVIPALAENWHLYAPDYRGHGRSGRTPGHYRAVDYFDDMLAFLEQVIPAPAVLLGHSMGGAVALGLAQEMPARVRGLIVGDVNLTQDERHRTASNPDVRAFFRERQKLAGQPVAALIPIVEQRGIPAAEAEDLSLLDPEVLAYHVAGRAEEFFEGLPAINLAAVTCPTLIIQGNPAMGGQLTDAEVALALDLMPDVTHVRITHAGHDLGFWQGNLTLFMDAVTAFLAERHAG